jgi:N-acetylglucosaminyl-diphospho-decaprenol L-rhamnosyltransferase
MLDLTVIVVNWNTRELLRACLASVGRHTSGLSYEIVVVDNGSTDGSVDMIRNDFPAVTLIANPDNRGFAAANNQGIRAANGWAIVLLNSDTELVENSLGVLYRFLFSNDKFGAVGGRLVYPGGAPQWSYGFAPSLGRMLWITVSGLLRISWGRKPPAVIPQEGEGPLQVEYVVGADLMLKKSVLDQVGVLDESFFAYAEETDLCTRIRQRGYKVWFTPETSIVHRIGSSFGPETLPRLRIYYTSLFLYMKKHQGGYALAKAYLLAKFGMHALVSRRNIEIRTRLRAIWLSGLCYPSSPKST